MNPMIEKILAECRFAAHNPRKMMAAHYKKTGQRAVGCLPLYCPEEIVHAAGFLPMGIWGAQVELNKVRSALPAFACSVMQSVMELSLQGTYDDLAAVLIPSPCDTLKAIGQKWNQAAVPGIQFVHPHNRQLDAARQFLKGEYAMIRRRLEEIAGQKITNGALAESIKLYNRHREAMNRFVEAAADYPHIITPIRRHDVMKSAMFMEKGSHTALVNQLTDALLQEEKKPWTGLKAVVTGIMLEPGPVLSLFEAQGIAIVADDLAQESRQYRVNAAETGDPLEALAAQWQAMYGCSLAFETEKSRVALLTRLVKEKQAGALIVCMMKFCDPEEFDYPIIQKKMAEEGIPLLQIEIDQQAAHAGQLRTRLQSFCEMIPIPAGGVAIGN